MKTETKVQPAKIEDLYSDFMQAHGKNKPVDANELDVLAALAASADLAKTKWVVTKPFKAGTSLYQICDMYPVTVNDRANVIRLCRTGYILPQGEYMRTQEYQANKGKVEMVKNLYQALQTASDNKTKTARNVDAVRLDLVTAEGLHSDAVKDLARIEGEILKALS